MRRKLIIAFSLLMMVTGAASAAPVSTTEAPPPLTHNVYLKLDGITGESIARNYENWIVLSGVQFDVSNSSSKGSLSGSGIGGAKATLDQFVITKDVDSSSIPLFLAAATGMNIKSGQIVFMAQGESKEPVLTIDLGSVNVASYDFNNVNETIQLKFDSIKLSYSPTNPNGSKNPPVSGGWSFFQNKKQ